MHICGKLCSASHKDGVVFSSRTKKFDNSDSMPMPTKKGIALELSSLPLSEIKLTGPSAARGLHCSPNLEGMFVESGSLTMYIKII